MLFGQNLQFAIFDTSGIKCFRSVSISQSEVSTTIKGDSIVAHGSAVIEFGIDEIGIVKWTKKTWFNLLLRPETLFDV